MRKFGDAKEAVREASGHMRNRRRDKKPIMNLFNKVFHMRDDDSTALTILSVAQRTADPLAGLFFLFMYGEDRDDNRLHELSGALYQRVRWPTKSGTVYPHAGIGICKYLLLRHRRRTHRKGEDRDKMFEGLPGPCDLARRIRVGCKKFIVFQNKEVFPIFRLWEDAAERQINDELAGKGFYG